MTLTDIIAEINEKYPNNLTTTSLVRKMDLLQKRLYNKMRKQTFQSFSLVTGQPTYPLSIGINNIYQVLVGNITNNQFNQYPFKAIDDTTICPSQYHYFISDIVSGDFIGIYPTPDASVDTAVLFFYEQPNALDPTQLGTTPTLDSNFHMLFVYHVCKEIAENYRDFDIANGFIVQYNALESEFMSVFQNPEVEFVHSESGW